MKSMFFKNLVKGLVIVSAALALVNCDDSTTSPANQEIGGGDTPAVVDPNDPAQQQPTDPSVTDPTVTDPTQQPTDPTVTDPTDPAQQGQVTDPTTTPESGEGIGGGAENPSNPADPASSSSEVVGPTDPAQSSSSEAVKPASSSSEQPAASSSSEVKADDGIFLVDGKEEEKNYLEVEYIKNTADNGGGVLCYPKQLSSTKKHGVILWGPGGGSSPNDYEGIIRRLASHGFVVVATSESPDGTDRGIPALNWLEKKNTTQGDVLYGKLDMTKVGASGHSMGGLQSEKMLINDKRVITAVLNNSGAFNHAELANVPAGKTAAIVYGEGGMERPNAEGDYNNNNVKIPACLLKMTGGQGNECQNGECGWGHGSGPWGGMAATVAWMRWHLGGEDFRKSDFVGSTGKYVDGAILGQPGKWKGQCKNF